MELDAKDFIMISRKQIDKPQAEVSSKVDSFCIVIEIITKPIPLELAEQLGDFFTNRTEFPNEIDALIDEIYTVDFEPTLDD